MGKSLLLTLLIGMGTVLCMSLVAYFYSDPDVLIRPLSLTAAGITAFFGGFCAIRIHGHSALFCGICNGVVFMSGMILLSLFFPTYASGYNAAVSCLLHIGFLALSVCGAFIGFRRSPRKKKRR